jgi:radical SAM protein with 4Fe4S-binding SPASM domain
MKAPVYLQFFPSFACNRSCSFCFNRGLAETGQTDPARFDQMVEIAAAHGIAHIDILGGEPTLYPHIEEIIGMIGAAGLTTTMSSNGSRIDVLERLARRFPQGGGLRIGISLNDDGIDEKLLEFIRRFRPVLKSVFSEQMDRLPAFLADQSGKGLDLRLIYRDAVFPEDLDKSIPFYAYHRLLGRIRWEEPKINGVYCSGFLPDDHYPVLHRVRCPAGTTKLAVLPDGSVYPCYLFFRHNAFRLGNLLKDGFKTIWENPILGWFRHFEKNDCLNRKCELFSRCHGGCPASALLLTGDLTAPDPRCCRIH